MNQVNLLAQSALLICILCQFSLSTFFEKYPIEQFEIAPFNITYTEVDLNIDCVKLIDTVRTSESTTTQFILVRHAEKTKDESNPNLSEAGVARASRLAYILSELEIDRIYSTDYNRTLQTAEPTAIDQGVEILKYNGSDQLTVIDEILNTQSGGTVLIVGHSNTIPKFINALTGTLDYETIEHEIYDDLFIISTQSIGVSEIIHLKY